jgi:DNA repair exonuclease SbcCD nuclease subunit
MKFLFITDTHGRMVNPENRKGNFFADLTDKIRAICEIAKAEAVDCVLHGGDFLDTERVSYELSDLWIDIIDSYKIPWHVIWGGHDEMNGHKSLNTTLSSVFRQSNTIRHLDVLQDENTFIQGFDYAYGCEFQWRDNGLYSSLRDEYKPFKIGVVHGMVMEKPWFPNKSHITYDELSSKTDFNLILIGHYHRYGGMKEVNGVKFFNPGAIARKKTDEAEQLPRGLIVDTVTKEMREVMIPCRPVEEVFDLAEVQQAKADEKSLDQFFTDLQSIEFRNHSLYDRVVEACAAENVTEKVKTELLERIKSIQH